LRQYNGRAHHVVRMWIGPGIDLRFYGDGRRSKKSYVELRFMLAIWRAICSAQLDGCLLRSLDSDCARGSNFGDPARVSSEADRVCSHALAIASCA